jgi:hypothetical protein
MLSNLLSEKVRRLGAHMLLLLPVAAVCHPCRHVLGMQRCEGVSQWACLRVRTLV